MGRSVSSGAGVAGAAQTLTVQGQVGKRICIEGAIVSYSAAPTGGRLQIVGQQSQYEWDVDITSAGPTELDFPGNGMEFEYGEPVVFTLAAAGGAIVGKINAIVAWRTIDENAY